MVDEPTIGLAHKICGEIAEVLHRMVDQLGLTLLITEQNAKFAMDLAERIYVIEHGKLSASKTWADLDDIDTLEEAYFGH